jgi:predicted acylesterase/phospholipase RssA
LRSAIGFPSCALFRRWRCATCCWAPAQWRHAPPSRKPIKQLLFPSARARFAFGPTRAGKPVSEGGAHRCCEKGQPLIYLALSGGGGGGAYGAGVLNGWSDSGNRPEFTVVSGVSTGALIAPFAFLGPDYDARLKKIYTTARRKI